ncbi:MAG: MFS transporter [Cyanobacteria bacterium P01_D01_bin.44]
MRTFFIIWIGQFASILGSGMTNFAITIWAWEVTGLATPLSLILFFTQASKMLASAFGGVLVDRLPRKQLVILGDLVAGLSTVAILLLFRAGHLEIWHLYCTGAVNSFFGFLQGLAYSTSLSLIVSKQNYTRAIALNSIHMSGSFILAPVLAGGLYSLIGLIGILKIDIATFMIAVITLCVVKIPQPDQSEITRQDIQTIWQDLTFGFRYLFRHLSLLASFIFWVANGLIDNLNFAILPTMLLARSGDDTSLVGFIFANFGIGGLLGAATISIWGGPKRRIHGVLLGSAIWKIGLILLCVTQGMFFKTTAALLSGFSSPFPYSSHQAIWFSKVEPAIQGRVFAACTLIGQIPRSLAAACAGILADNFFEPAMKPGGSLVDIFGDLFGNQTGSGMALMITLCASFGLLAALAGYAVPILRDVEDILPDHESVARTSA